EVCPGNEHTAKHAQPGLLKILDGLPPGRKPKLIRGDNAFGNDPLMTAFVEADRKTGKGITGYEYAVLVTNTDHEVLSLGQLYRDRADAENVFDELKNPWGWGGFTTHDPHRCQLAARGVALAYNALLQGWGAQAAEQLNPVTVWQRVCDRLKLTLAGIGPPPILRLLENHANGIG
ncbi:MAG: transposase, partial [Sulfurisoma sp.]|nr:transposase [Sulfurisoma sp.]